MNPLALLKALPLKDYLYLGAIVVILLGVWGYTHHERAVGAAVVVAQDKKLADAALKHNQDVTDLATARTTKTGDTYVATIAQPIADSPHVSVCKRAAPTGSSAVPETAGNTGLPVAAANSAEANPVDIGPPLDRTGRDADALIVALQDEVRIMVSAMNGQTAP